MKFITLLCNLENKRVILASQSPRRIELLRSIGMEFEIYSPNIEEKISDSKTAVEYVRHNASEKAHWVANYIRHDLIIAADTVVTLDERMFEKPVDRKQARDMLRALSDKTHRVVTAICLLGKSKLIIEHEITEVTFYPLGNDEIQLYLQSGESFDKAGAYGIQGLASIFIKKINGCYFNVVGFPLGKFYQCLKKMEIV